MPNLEGNLKRLRSAVFFWESPDRSFPCRLLTEDGRIEDIELAMNSAGCMESPRADIYQAWQLDQSNLTKDPDRGLVQVICERDWSPLPLWRENPARWHKDEVDKIFERKLGEAQTIATRKNSRDMALYIMFAMALLVFFAVAYALIFLRTDWTSTFNAVKGVFGR